MARMFSHSKFRADLSQWSVNKVKDFRYMFEDATEFRGDLSNWKTDSALEMEGMFQGAVRFNSSVASFNVSRVSNFRNM